MAWLLGKLIHVSCLTNITSKLEVMFATEEYVVCKINSKSDRIERIMNTP